MGWASPYEGAQNEPSVVKPTGPTGSAQPTSPSRRRRQSTALQLGEPKREPLRPSSLGGERDESPPEPTLPRWLPTPVAGGDAEMMESPIGSA
ncbi:hypothetical protein NL676_001325 [Syzygium grande]|nr:hypothetical protein NL676_001325 [Syzygium grande]